MFSSIADLQKKAEKAAKDVKDKAEKAAEDAQKAAQKAAEDAKKAAETAAETAQKRAAEASSQFSENAKAMQTNAQQAGKMFDQSAGKLFAQMVDTPATAKKKQEEEVTTHEFEEGSLGLELEGLTVVVVSEGGQAEKLGVSIGSQLVAVAGERVPGLNPGESETEGNQRLKRMIGKRIKSLPRPVELTFSRSFAAAAEEDGAVDETSDDQPSPPPPAAADMPSALAMEEVEVDDGGWGDADMMDLDLGTPVGSAQESQSVEPAAASQSHSSPPCVSPPPAVSGFAPSTESQDFLECRRRLSVLEEELQAERGTARTLTEKQEQETTDLRHRHKVAEDELAEAKESARSSSKAQADQLTKLREGTKLLQEELEAQQNAAAAGGVKEDQLLQLQQHSNILQEELLAARGDSQKSEAAREAQLSEVRQRCSVLDNELCEAQESTRALGETEAATQAGLRQHIEDLQQQNLATQQEVQKSRVDADHACKATEQFQSELAESQKARDSFEASMTQKFEDVQSRGRAALNDSKGRVELLTSELQQLQESQEGGEQSSTQGAEMQVFSMKEELRALHVEHDGQMEALKNHARSVHAESRERIETLELELANTNAKHSGLLLQIDTERNEHERAANELAECRANHDALVVELDEARTKQGSLSEMQECQAQELLNCRHNHERELEEIKSQERQAVEQLQKKSNALAEELQQAQKAHEEMQLSTGRDNAVEASAMHDAAEAQLCEVQETLNAKSEKLVETEELRANDAQMLQQTAAVRDVAEAQLCEVQETLNATSEKLKETEELRANDAQMLQQTASSAIKGVRDELQKKIRGLTDELQASRGQIEILQTKVQCESEAAITMQKAVEMSAEGQVGEMASVRQIAQQQVDTLQHELRETRLKQTSLEATIQHQRDKAESHQEITSDALECVEARLADEAEELGQSRRDLRAAVDRGNRALRELEDVRTERTRLLNNSSNRDARLGTAQAMLESRAQRLQEQLEVAQEQIETSNQEESNLSVELSAVGSARAELHSEALQEGEELRVLRRQFSSHEAGLAAELSCTKNELASTESARKKVEETARHATSALAEVGVLQEALARADDEASAAKRQASSHSSKLESEISRLRADCAATTEQVESNKQLVRSLQVQLADAHRAAELLRTQPAQPPSPPESAGGDIEEALPHEGDVEEPEAGTGDAPSDVETPANKDIQALRSHIAALETKCSSMQKKLNSRPIIYQVSQEYGDTRKEETPLGPDTRPDWEKKLTATLKPFANLVEPMLRSVTQKILKREKLFWVFWVHLLLLYFILAVHLSGVGDFADPAKCLESRGGLQQPSKRP